MRQESTAIRRIGRKLLLLGLCFALTTGAMAAPKMIVDRGARDEAPASAGENRYRVQLETRAFVPRARADAAGLRQEKVFLQFQRTLTAEEQASLEEAGVAFHESLAPFTYLVAMTAEAADAVQRNPLFLGAEPIQPADKITATLSRGESPEHARRPGGAIAVSSASTRTLRSTKPSPRSSVPGSPSPSRAPSSSETGWKRSRRPARFWPPAAVRPCARRSRSRRRPLRTMPRPRGSRTCRP